MLHLHKLNPLVRAVGTVGAVAGLAVGITFAAQPSNTVTLTDNTITTTTASLGIATGTNCTVTPGTTAAGMTVTKLAPGATSSPFNFCLDNTGTTPLAVSVTSPTDFTGSAIPLSDLTLNLKCGSASTATAIPFTSLGTPSVVDGSLAASTNDACTATVTLSSSYTGSGGSVTPFELDFSGTSTT